MDKPVPDPLSGPRSAGFVADGIARALDAAPRAHIAAGFALDVDPVETISAVAIFVGHHLR